MGEVLHSVNVGASTISRPPGARLRNGRDVVVAPTFAFCVLAAALLLTGCYHLGPNPPKGYSSIAVPVFKVGPKVFHPGLQAPVTDALIKWLQADNAVKVLAVSEADTVLDGTIVGYNLHPLRFQRSNQQQTREYRLTLTAHIVLKKAGTDDVIVEDKSVNGETSFFILGDLTTSENQALPLAADDLARNIAKLVAEGW